jgi:hypothetical protein
MSLKEKNKKVSLLFSELTESIKLKLTESRKERTYRQNYLFLIINPAFNYTEAIISLCKNGSYNAAHVLLRSLFELHLNCQYYMFGDSEKKLALAAKRQFDWRANVIREVKIMIENYPNLKSSTKGSLYHPDYLDSKQEEISNILESIIKMNRLDNKDKDPKLIEKAKECDKQSEVPEPGYFENMYHLVYRQLSPYVHLDIQGVEFFHEENNKGEIISIDKNSEDILISQSVGISIALIKDLHDEEIIQEVLPEDIKLIEDVLNS